MPSADSRRPNPEELLRHVQADERRESVAAASRFSWVTPPASASRSACSMKAAGAKSAARTWWSARAERRHARRSRRSSSGSKSIPSISDANTPGRTYEVMDLAALFRRHPQVCLIDGLAYDNPPGSRNPQRWQDVEELLDRGISVITAVNLQHIREQQDAVERITGKRAANSIPGSFLREADEIEMVDAPPEALLDRTGRQVTCRIRAAWPNCANWRCCWPRMWWTASCRSIWIPTA